MTKKDIAQVMGKAQAASPAAVRSTKKPEVNTQLGSLEIWGDDDFYVRGAISDAAQPLLDYMRAHYTDPETFLQMDMTGKIFVYQPNVLRPDVSCQTVSAQTFHTMSVDELPTLQEIMMSLRKYEGCP